MKQKLLHIILIITCAFAWSGEVWGDTWDQWIGKSGSGTKQGNTWYVWYEDKEYSVGVGIGVETSREHDLSGPGTTLSFEAKRSATGIGQLKVDKFVNGGYTNIYGQNPGKVEKTFLGIETSIGYVSYGTYDVKGATKLKFYESGASYEKFYRKMRVPMAQYLIEPSQTSSLKTIAFGTDKVDKDETQSFTIHWCNIPALSTSVTGTNASDVEVSITNNSEAGKYNTATISVKYKRKTAGNLNATLTITNSYGNYSKSITLTGSATKYDQTLSWNNESSINTNLKVNNTQNISATATSGLAVSYSSSNSSVLKVNSSTGAIEAVNAGSATITATQSGNYKYNAASSITKSFTVTKNANTLSVSDKALKVEETTAGYANKNSGAEIHHTIDDENVISYNPSTNTITALNSGTAKLRIYQDPTVAYEGVDKTLTVTVTKHDQTISWSNESAINTNLKVDNEQSVAATASSNLAVTYTSSNSEVVTVDNSGNMKAVGAGSATITVSQAGNYKYNAASSISKTFTVTKYDQTISWNNNITDLNLIAGQTLNTNTAHASSYLPVVYSSSDTGVLDVDSSTGLLTAVSEGTATITVSQAGNYKYNAATSITRNFTIAEKKQATFTPAWWEGENQPSSTDIKVGTNTTIELNNVATDATFTISAKPEGIVNWTREGNTLTISGSAAGTTELTLSQTGSAILNGNTAKYTITVSRYPNTFAVDAENKAMKVGEEWTDVVTKTGNNNTQVSYSADGVATYDAENNKIIAQGEGSTIITFTQAATADYEAKTINVNVTVTKVANTLSVSLPTQATEVGGTITLAISGKNNPDAIVATITDTQLSSTVNNGSDVITYANGVITARNAGTAHIKFSQPATAKYTAYASQTYEITVTKRSNAITLTLNGAAATNIKLKYGATATLAYTRTNMDTTPTVTRTSGSYTTLAGSTITAGNAAGTDIYEVSQAETYKYEAGYAQFSIRVNNTDEGTAYVLYEEKEYSHGTGAGVTHTYQLSGPGETLSYTAGTWFAAIYYNLYVEWSADNSSWTVAQDNQSLSGTENKDFSCAIPENARYVRFRFPGGGTSVKNVSNVKATRKTYVRATSNTTAFGNTYTDQTKTATFTVNYSSANGGNINVSSSNPHFVPSISAISVPTNKTAVDNSNGNNTSYICGVDGTQTFTVTYTPDPDQLGAEEAVITIGDLFHSQKITLTATSQKYSTSIARGTNTATETTVDGSIANAFAFSGTSTATPSASSDADFYYTISHTQTSGVNNGTGVISYDPATNTITGLNQGTARLTIYQKKTNLYNATSQTFDFSVSKLENNTIMTLSTKTLNVDGTATVELMNADSDGGLSASYSNTNYQNESQNREGGLLTFAGNTLTGWNAGTGTVTITQAETYKYVSKSQSFNVTVNKLTQALTWDNPDLETTMQVGSTLEGNTATSDAGLTPVTYSSGNTAAITVDANTGVLTAVATGSNVGITASQAGNYKYAPASLTRLFSVFNKQTPAFVADAHFTGANGRIEYTFSATITVTGVSDEDDFSITNGDNTVINVVREGKTITITGLKIGNTTLTLAQQGNDDFIAKTQTYNIEVYWPDDFLALTPTETPSITEGTYRKVFFNRDFSAIGYYSLALPFSTTVAALTGRAANADDWVAQLETVTYNEEDGYTLYFNKVTDGYITANEPYILHLGAEVVNPTWTNVEVEEAEETTVEAKAGYGNNIGAAGIFSDWSMTSNFNPEMSMSGRYGVVNGAGGLKKGGSTATLNAFAAYITPPAGSAGVKVQSAFTDEWGVTTYIKGLPDDGAESEACGDELYDLSGRRIDSRQQPTRGIYVRGGRRVVVK